LIRERHPCLATFAGKTEIFTPTDTHIGREIEDFRKSLLWIIFGKQQHIQHIQGQVLHSHILRIEYAGARSIM